MEEESIEELTLKLSEFNEQLQQVNALLKEDPGNEEYLQIRSDLNDIIKLTKDVLKIKHEEQKTSPTSTSTSHTTSSPPQTSLVAAPVTTLSSSPSFFSIGTVCESRYSVDGTWYKAKIDSILEGGMYQVTYLDYGNQEIVSIADIRPLKDIVKQSKNLPIKRPLVPDSIQQIPKSLQILPTDSEDVRAAKKKRVHAIKSQNRLKSLEQERTDVQDKWMEFQKKSKKKVPMTLSDRKKSSIFASPDSVTGKVGVTGSGMFMISQERLTI
jgi:survival of motor neuron-related-splicing factor 30